MSLSLTRRTVKGSPITAAEHDANLDALEAAAFPDSVLVVRKLADLPAPVGDEIILPAKTVLIAGAIDLGSNALRLSTATVLRGLGTDSVMSSNPNGVIRATNLGSAVVMREFSVIATAGPCLDLAGTTEYQLNMFFVGLFGPSIGTVSGFDVQAFKDCFADTADGLTLTGTTNKVFLSQCPFYGITAGNAAITLNATLNARRVDMVQNFFKHDASGIPLRAEAGYTVGYGRVNGVMLDGPAQMLEGLASSDENWFFAGNDKVPDSRVAAQSYLTAPATTTITTASTFVQVAGPFTVSDLTQRMVLSGTNQLEYTGGDPVLVTFSGNFSVDPANNDRLAFRVTKNGATLEFSESIVEQGAGPGSGPRSGSVTALVEMMPGDTVGLAVANLDTTGDVPWLSSTFAVTA